MGKNFEFEWYTIEVRESIGKMIWEIKAKNKDNAIKQIKKMKDDFDKEIQRVRPNFEIEIFWDTLTLDRKGYQRLF